MEHWQGVTHLLTYLHGWLDVLSDSSLFNLILAIAAAGLIGLIKKIYDEVIALFNAFIFLAVKIQNGLSDAIDFLEKELERLCAVHQKAYEKYMRLRPESQFNLWHPAVRDLRKAKKEIHRTHRMYHLARTISFLGSALAWLLKRTGPANDKQKRA